jgi:hypothetical protein
VTKISWRSVRRAVALASAALLAGAGRAEARLVLPHPPQFGDVPASTYDLKGHRLGGATLSLERRDDRTVRIELHSGADSGAPSIMAHAELAPTPDGSGLVVLREQVQSTDAEGRALKLLRVDHVRREGSCTSPDGEMTRAPLPTDERVANVPLNLLFLPLVRGEAKQIRFQYFLCRGGARLIDFFAFVAATTKLPDGRRVVEVRYGPDLNRVVSWFASWAVPKLSFWFEADAENAYLANRMPLFPKGPEVLVVRDGIDPTALSR